MSDRRALAQAIDDLLDALDVPLLKRQGINPAEGRINPIEARMSETLIRIWGNQFRRALSSLESLFAGVEGTLSAGEFNTAATLLARIMGPDFAALTAEQLGNLIGMGYMAGRRSTARKLQVTPHLGLVDKRTQTVLAHHTVYWVGQHYDDALRGTIEATVREFGFNQGLGREAIGQRLKDALGATIARSDTYWRGLAAVTLTRSRAMGAVQSFVESGWESYEIVAMMDERTSHICREMNGRIWKVERAVTLRDAMMTAQSPQDVKDLAPWVKVGTVQGHTTTSLPGGLAFPPYHFHCRTQVVAYVEEVGDGRTTRAIMEDRQDASATVKDRLGVFTPEELATKVNSLRGAGWDKQPASEHLGVPDPNVRQIIGLNNQARELMRQPDAVYAYSSGRQIEWAFVKGGKVATLSDDNWTFLSMGNAPLVPPANWTRITVRGG